MRTYRHQLIEIATAPLLFAEVGLRLVAVTAALHGVNFKSLAYYFAKSRLRVRAADLEKAQRFSGVIERRLLLGKPSCLRTSFVLFWMSDRGTQLCIGVRKNQDLEAHAWIKHRERVFSTTNDFDEFDSLLKITREV